MSKIKCSLKADMCFRLQTKNKTVYPCNRQNVKETLILPIRVSTKRFVMTTVRRKNVKCSSFVGKNILNVMWNILTLQPQ